MKRSAMGQDDIEDSGSSGSESPSTDIDGPPPLAHNESVAVKRSKWLVLFALIGAAAVVAGLVYYIASSDERANFMKEVRTFDSEIIANAELIMRDFSSVLQSLSTSMTSNALSGNQTWPNVSVPYFHIRSREAKMFANMDTFVLSPLVEAHNRCGWEAYSTNNQQWIRDGLDYQELHDIDPGAIPLSIYPYSGDETTVMEEAVDGVSLPVWQVGAAPTNAKVVNLDLLSHPVIRDVVNRAMRTRQTVLSPIFDLNFLVEFSNTDDVDDRRRKRSRRAAEIKASGETVTEEDNQDIVEGLNGKEEGDESQEDEDSDEREGEQIDGTEVEAESTGPRALVVQPVYSSFDENKEVVGFVMGCFSWRNVFRNRLIVKNMIVTLKSSCGDHPYTFEIGEKFVTFRGEGDFHDTSMDSLLKRQEFEPFQEEWEELLHIIEDEDETECEYTLEIYPTKALEDSFSTIFPMLYAFVVVFIFSAASVVFILYDYMVQRRQRKVMQSAESANAIVSSIFPQNVKERLLQTAEEKVNKKIGPTKQGAGFAFGAQKQLKGTHNSVEFEKEEPDGLVTAYSTKPIADLFTHATVMFADIAGFTAWSSEREASQVFVLLETVYASFDKVAKALKVFKVETIGDCYVAVAGLPVPRADHATVMATFAKACLRSFTDLSKRLEVVLGPGTGSLALRVGLHSGPVTAGVLRGDNARFQLFGDTVNVASRMESTGEKGKIQVSNETAMLLLKAGQSLILRADKVEAKGKGQLQTYWLKLDGESGEEEDRTLASERTKAASHSLVPSGDVERNSSSHMKEETNRLVEWNTNNLVRLLRVLHAQRSVRKTASVPSGVTASQRTGAMVLDEVKEIIDFPKFDAETAQQEVEASMLHLKPQVSAEVKLFVKCIAKMYHRNPFHNFEHASHVTMSVVKLLSRISSSGETSTGSENAEAVRSQHHLDTYGITADPLTCFGCVFSALIHDVDHSGVSNAQLVAEGGPLVRLYAGKSVAEQNSVDKAWKLLEEQSFANFREAIFTNDEERARFRQIVVNSVMATDIMDKELKKLRDSRWDKAFLVTKSKSSNSVAKDRVDTVDECINRKATIVIEHLIQASDVAHTMQHWHVYRQWNEKLYIEMYRAFKDGRSTTDPTLGWYHGEIGFFDYYIVPLAKKLSSASRALNT